MVKIFITVNYAPMKPKRAALNSKNIIYKDSELCPLYISVVAVHQSVRKQVVIEQ